MTDRERLVVLLDAFVFDEWYGNEEIADYLLANGVIVLPCKVGDVVYKVMDIETVHAQILEVKVWSIEISETITFFIRTLKDYRYKYSKFNLEDFGKTVFLSREEAETKLKKGNENE